MSDGAIRRHRITPSMWHRIGAFCLALGLVGLLSGVGVLMAIGGLLLGAALALMR